MTEIQLVSAIEHLAESSRALDRLLRMPRQDVEQVLSLLSNDAAIRSLRQLLRTVRELQRGQRADPPGRMPGSRRETDADLEQMLRHVLSDQERFPTVAAVSSFVSRVFGIRVSSQKNSRDRYIRKVVRAVKDNPKALHNARNALVHGRLDKDKAYLMLYDFIRGRLTE